MHAFYRDNPMSVTSFAIMSDAGVLESLSHLAAEGSLPVRCCRGTAEEMSQAQAAIADGKALVIDPSALATLFFSGQYEHLRNLPGKCVVCESALEEYAELQRQFATPSRGFAGKFKGKYLFREDDPEERERQEMRLATFHAGIRPLVTLRTGENLARINSEKRKEMVGLFGRPTAEAVAEAAATGAVLWTDDMAVAEVARHHAKQEKRVWTQAVFITTAPSQACDDMALFLLQWRYFFTRIQPGLVVPAGNQAEWDAKRQPLAGVLTWLSAPELEEDGAIMVGAGMLPLIWRHAPLPLQREAVTRMLAVELLKRQGGRHIVAGFITAIDTLFKIDVIGRESCKRVLQAVLDRRTPGGLFLPPGVDLAS